MEKIKGQSTIGIAEKLEPNEVFQIGQSGPIYRVIRLIKMTDREGNIHRIRRVDGESITSFDLGVATVGSKVRVFNRENFWDLFEQAYEIYDPYKKPEDNG